MILFANTLRLAAVKEAGHLDLANVVAPLIPKAAVVLDKAFRAAVYTLVVIEEFADREWVALPDFECPMYDLNQVNVSDYLTTFWQTFEDSFSAGSKPNFATPYSLEGS